MPWTFAHPAAVLPLRRFCPRYLNFPALVVGSLMPDFAYYVPAADFAQPSHSIQGIAFACVPLGLLLLCALLLMRKPLCFMLPQPRRAALSALATRPVHLRPALLASVAASLVLGACTHVAWDAFTHENYRVAQYLTLLQETAFRVGSTDVPVCYLLQLLSSIAGVAALAIAYRNVLRRHAVAERWVTDAGGERWRWSVLRAITIAALIAATALAADVVAPFDGAYAVAVFMRSMAIFGTDVFVVLMVAAALCCYGYSDARVRGRMVVHGFTELKILLKNIRLRVIHQALSVGEVLLRYLRMQCCVRREPLRVVVGGMGVRGKCVCPSRARFQRG